MPHGSPALGCACVPSGSRVHENSEGLGITALQTTKHLFYLLLQKYDKIIRIDIYILEIPACLRYCLSKQKDRN